MPSALALFAHPDDIEFVAAGTLILLKDLGWQIHYCNIANGCCGWQISTIATAQSGQPLDTTAWDSAGTNFKVQVGTNGGTSGLGSQGTVVNSATAGTGSTADISSQNNAQAAVSALADAVSSLGSAQAAVGKGQNQFSFAVNLASSKLTNLAAAESRIRDADLASEAANLSKSQILLQAGISALAQANSAPQQVLALLRG